MTSSDRKSAGLAGSAPNTPGSESTPPNVPGKYGVDASCIGCDICPEIAPANFRSHPDSGCAYVYKQPAGRDEQRQCAEAMQVCPVDAIASVGDPPVGETA